jgi:hypothetical protein
MASSQSKLVSNRTRKLILFRFNIDIETDGQQRTLRKKALIGVLGVLGEMQLKQATLPITAQS